MTKQEKANAYTTPRNVPLLLLLVVIFVVVLLTLELESRPDTGASDLVSHTKPIKCTINGSLDSSEDDLSLGGGGGGRRNEGTARGRRRNKGRGGGAVGEGNDSHSCSGDGESNHFYVGFGFWLGFATIGVDSLNYERTNNLLISSASALASAADVSILASSDVSFLKYQRARKKQF